MKRLIPTTATLAACSAMVAPLCAQSVIELPALVVTARRGSILPEHFSGNATVIEEKQVRESGSRSVGELLQSQAGLRITSSSGDVSRGSVSLRGFGENASSRTLILIDGKPINRPDMAAANLQEIPIARVARVEILRGSQTARFGDQAVGGVINIVTKQPTDGKSLQLETAFGSERTRITRLSHAQDKDGQKLTIDAEFNRTDGWRENSMSESDSLSTAWSRQPSPDLRLNGAVSWGRQQGRFPGPLSTSQYLANPRQSIYTGNSPEQYGSSQTTVRADLGAELDTAHLGTAALPVSWQSRDLAWNMGPGQHADNALHTLTLTPSLQQLEGDWKLQQGIDLRSDWLDVTNYREMARLRPSAFSYLQRQVWGAYALADWNPLPDWHFNAAARAAWSDLNAKSRNVKSPNNPKLNFSRSGSEENAAAQLGVRWEPSTAWAAWLRYDRLYRLPSVDEIAAYQGFPLAEPFNDQLAAETGHNLELGAEWTTGPWLLRANGFAQQLNGEIAYDYTRNLNVNLTDTTRVGGELEAGYQGEGWSASVRYSGVDARFADGPYDGNRISLVPEHQLCSTLGFQLHERVDLQVEHQWQSECIEGNDFSNSQPGLPSFSVMNVMLTYRPAERVSCYFRVTNLWDEHYATLKYSGVWYPAAGRQFLLGVRYDF